MEYSNPAQFCLILTFKCISLSIEGGKRETEASFSKSSRVLNSHSRIIFNDGMKPITKSNK